MSLLVSSLYDLQTQKFLLENEGKTRGGYYHPCHWGVIVGLHYDIYLLIYVVI